MAKVVFVAFAIEDESQRTLLRGQSLNTKTPFDYVDMGVSTPYETGWKEKVRTRIRRSDGVIALVSSSTRTATGQLWEITCAKEEGKPILGIWAYSDDRTTVTGLTIVPWSWPAIARFIDSL
jgi:hypothetical protein